MTEEPVRYIAPGEPGAIRAVRRQSQRDTSKLAGTIREDLRGEAGRPRRGAIKKVSASDMTSSNRGRLLKAIREGTDPGLVPLAEALTLRQQRGKNGLREVALIAAQRGAAAALNTLDVLLPAIIKGRPPTVAVAVAVAISPQG